MAEHRPTAPGAPPRPQMFHTPSRPTTFLRKLHDHIPNSTQLVGLLTLIVSGVILLLLIGLAISAVVMGLILFVPVAMITSPIWVPAGSLLFLGVLSVGGFGAAVVGGGSWLYKYLHGRHPLGSDRVDYARSRMADTASHLRDYVKDYSGYLTQGKAKDAAPGA